VLDSDIDSTDGTARSFSESAEAFTMNKEELSASARGRIRTDVSELQAAVCESVYNDNWFLMTPSIATKFQYVNSFLFSSFSLHVSAPMGHLQVRYTIGYFNGLFLIQRIHCTYAT
jgi:hypothetical protein